MQFLEICKLATNFMYKTHKHHLQISFFSKYMVTARVRDGWNAEQCFAADPEVLRALDES